MEVINRYREELSHQRNSLHKIAWPKSEIKGVLHPERAGLSSKAKQIISNSYLELLTAITSHITYLIDLMRPQRKENGGSRQPSQPALFLLTQFWTISAPHKGQTQSKRLPIGIPRELPWLRSYIFWDRSRVLHPPAKYLTPPSNQFFLPQSTTCEHSIPKIKINCHDVQFLDIWGFSSLWGSQYISMCWEQPKWQILLSAFPSSLLLYWNVFWGTKTNSPKQTCVALCCFNGITPTRTKMKFQFARQLLQNP